MKHVLERPSARGGDEVMEQLREQAALYGRLESIARRQRRLVTDDDPTPLLALLADRQSLAVEMSRAAERFEPMRRDWPCVREGLSSAQRAEADAQQGEIRHSLQRVLASDEQDARVLAARREAAARELRATHSSAAAISAYAPGRGAMVVDRLDEAS